MLALTRAEIVQRMRTPVVTQADGLVRVFANCPEDMCREYQSPVARCAADTVSLLYRGLKMKPIRFESPQIIVHLGDVRTNVTSVVARVTTNDNEIVTRIYLKSPGGANLEQFKTEIVRAFYRSVRKIELSEDAARQAMNEADPDYHVAIRRAKIEAWLAGDRSARGAVDDESWDEEHLTLMRKVLKVGVSSPRDVQTFASRLYFYPPLFSEPFEGGRTVLSFSEAIDLVGRDERLRDLAQRKAVEIAAFGGGRSEELGVASAAYVVFLTELSKEEPDIENLKTILLNADKWLTMAWGCAKKE